MERIRCGGELIADERTRQIKELGYDEKNDQYYSNEELVLAALCYATPKEDRKLRDNGVPYNWPWADIYWKPTPEDRNRELVKAGALIAAQIDRNLIQ